MHGVYELCYILIISILNFLLFIYFTNQITLKPNLPQKLKLVFELSTIMEQINVPIWLTWSMKDKERMEKIL